VLTPKVAAQPDGLHLRVGNRLSKATTYTSEPSGRYFLSLPITIPKGISNHAVEFPAGIAGFQCDPDGQFNIYEVERAQVQIVAGDSGYKPLELECEPGAAPAFGVASDFGGYTGSRPAEHARRTEFSDNLKEDDVVEEAGYPQEPDPKPVRVVLNGKAASTIEYSASGNEETYCAGQF
jgi:hypothetical protein